MLRFTWVEGGLGQDLRHRVTVPHLLMRPWPVPRPLRSHKTKSYCWWKTEAWCTFLGCNRKKLAPLRIVTPRGAQRPKAALHSPWGGRGDTQVYFLGETRALAASENASESSWQTTWHKLSAKLASPATNFLFGAKKYHFPPGPART